MTDRTDAAADAEAQQQRLAAAQNRKRATERDEQPQGRSNEPTSKT